MPMQLHAAGSRLASYAIRTRGRPAPGNSGMLTALRASCDRAQLRGDFRRSSSGCHLLRRDSERDAAAVETKLVRPALRVPRARHALWPLQRTNQVGRWCVWLFWAGFRKLPARAEGWQTHFSRPAVSCTFTVTCLAAGTAAAMRTSAAGERDHVRTREHPEFAAHARSVQAQLRTEGSAGIAVLGSSNRTTRHLPPRYQVRCRRLRSTRCVLPHLGGFWLGESWGLGMLRVGYRMRSAPDNARKAKRRHRSVPARLQLAWVLLSRRALRSRDPRTRKFLMCAGSGRRRNGRRRRAATRLRNTP